MLFEQPIKKRDFLIITKAENNEEAKKERKKRNK